MHLKITIICIETNHNDNFINSEYCPNKVLGFKFLRNLIKLFSIKKPINPEKITITTGTIILTMVLQSEKKVIISRFPTLKISI